MDLPLIEACARSQVLIERERGGDPRGREVLHSFTITRRTQPCQKYYGCDLADQLQESLGPSGPEIQKKVRKKSPRPSGPGAPKSLEKSEKSGGKSRKCPFETFLRPGEKGKNPLEKSQNPVEKIPRNFRFLSLVVVKCVLSDLSLKRAGKRPININTIFTGLSRDCAGVFLRFPGIVVVVFPFSPNT